MYKDNFVESLIYSEPDNPHHKVAVRCLRCGESFLREYGNVHIPHDCSHYIMSGDRAHHKWCQGCRQYIPSSDFHTDETQFDGAGRLCRYCTENNVLEQKALRLLESHRYGRVHQLGVRLSDIVDQYRTQNGLCFYTKIPLEFDGSLRSMELACTPSNQLILICRALADGNDTLADFVLEAVRTARGNVRLETKIIHEKGQLPSRRRISDVGYDLHAAEDAVIRPGITQSVNTGIIVCPPEGAYYTIEGRSSLFTAGIMPYRGIVDGTYQGPLEVVLMNSSTEPYSVHAGDRIAQLIIHPIVNADFIAVDEFTPIKHGRNDSGWGSSGK